MTEERIEVMQAVLRGELGAEHVTMAEIRELEEVIMDAIIAKKLEDNPMVFSGFESRLTQ